MQHSELLVTASGNFGGAIWIGALPRHHDPAVTDSLTPNAFITLAIMANDGFPVSAMAL